MKYIILLLLPISLFGQYKAYKVGIKSGINFSDINAGAYDNPFTGVHAGGFINGVVNDRIEIGSEIFYSYQGANIPVDGADDYAIKSNLFNTNVLCRLFIVPNKIHLHAGVQLGFMMKQTVNDVKLSGPSKAEDFSIITGLGYSIKDFEIITRYSYGLAEVENRVLQVAVAYTVFHF